MKCHRIIASIFRKHFKEFGVTNSQFSMMLFISKAKKVNQALISKQMHLDKSSVNRNLKRLLDQGWVQKEDKMILTMTPKGFELMEEMIPKWNLAMDEVKEAIGEDGIRAVDLLLAKLS
ncbi:MAG: MarR family transcriptional regulator [Bacteroidota bacterium]